MLRRYLDKHCTFIVKPLNDVSINDCFFSFRDVTINKIKISRTLLVPNGSYPIIGDGNHKEIDY